MKVKSKCNEGQTQVQSRSNPSGMKVNLKSNEGQTTQVQ